MFQALGKERGLENTLSYLPDVISVWFGQALKELFFLNASLLPIVSEYFCSSRQWNKEDQKHANLYVFIALI